jgi:hypothetical protein
MWKTEQVGTNWWIGNYGRNGMDNGIKRKINK